jgi:hypothetical protein
MANNPFALSFAPITNALAGIQKQRNTDREFEESGRRWEQQNWLAQGQFDLQKQAAARQAAEYDRQNTVRGEVTNWLAQNPNVGGVPSPLVDLARIQGDPSVVQNYLLADAKRRSEMATREAPSNVREWQYFSRLPQEEQQKYLTMKRAQQWHNAGTEFVQMNPVDPTQRRAAIPIDNAGKERASEIGRAGGKAVTDLPRIEGNADQALKTIDQIRNHPGKGLGTGIAGAIPPIPGTAQAGFVDLVNQAKGKAFLEAFNSLKGGGQITEIEGEKATQAIARLNRARRPEDFDAALKDLEDVIRLGVDRARKAASAGSGPPPASSGGGFSIRRLD